MIRIALLDDHPLVRAGLEAILAPERDLVLVGAAASEEQLWPLLHTTRPDVLVLDLHHPGRDGLALAVRIKREPLAPRVIVHSASPLEDLLVPATLAGADGLVAKTAPTRELLRTLRSVGGGGRALPPIVPLPMAAAAARLTPGDRPIFAMRLAGTTPKDIAQTLGLAPAELAERVAAMVTRLTLGAIVDQTGGTQMLQARALQPVA
jgi:DNA-binding NarL/FixJ family response regulator